MRTVNRTEGRLKEAVKLGFSSAITASGAMDNPPLKLRGFATLAEAMSQLLPVPE